MVAARVLFSGRRFGAIADIGESGAATAIRRAMLLCSLLGSVVRFLLVIPRQGRHFWAAARAQLVTNALVVGLGCLLLRAVESPDAYPLGVSFAGAMAISASLAVYAAALRPANRERCATGKELLVWKLLGAWPRLTHYDSPRSPLSSFCGR